MRTNGICIQVTLKTCRSSHQCSVCQEPHHTLLHIENTARLRLTWCRMPLLLPPWPPQLQHPIGIKSEMLLMTHRVRVEAPEGSTKEARAMLDSGSSASFISEHLAQSLYLPRTSQNTRISGFVCNSTQPVTSFISSTFSPEENWSWISSRIATLTWRMVDSWSPYPRSLELNPLVNLGCRQSADLLHLNALFTSSRLQICILDLATPRQCKKLI